MQQKEKVLSITVMNRRIHELQRFKGTRNRTRKVQLNYFSSLKNKV